MSTDQSYLTPSRRLLLDVTPCVAMLGCVLAVGFVVFDGSTRRIGGPLEYLFLLLVLAFMVVTVRAVVRCFRFDMDREV